MTLALGVVCLALAVNAGLLAAGAKAAHRRPSPAENARRYSEEGGTW